MAITEPRTLGPQPEPLRPPGDLPAEHDHTILFDVERKTAVDLGVGIAGTFSPDGKLMACWSYGSREEAFLIETDTLRRQSLGPGRAPFFLDNKSVVVFEGGNKGEIVDIFTLARRPYNGPLDERFKRQEIPGGGHLMLVSEAGNPDTNRRYVAYDNTGRPVFQFDAATARPAGPNEVLFATNPAGEFTNLYVASLTTGVATYVTTILYETWNMPITATADYVAWVDAFCRYDRPEIQKTKVLNRRTGKIVEFMLRDGFHRNDSVRLTPGNLLGIGSFGAKLLIHPDTLDYVTVLPQRDTSWSPDYRYASQGAPLGHGGLCP